MPSHLMHTGQALREDGAPVRPAVMCMGEMAGRKHGSGLDIERVFDGVKDVGNELPTHPADDQCGQPTSAQGSADESARGNPGARDQVQADGGQRQADEVDEGGAHGSGLRFGGGCVRSRRLRQHLIQGHRPTGVKLDRFHAENGDAVRAPLRHSRLSDAKVSGHCGQSSAIAIKPVR